MGQIHFEYHKSHFKIYIYIYIYLNLIKLIDLSLFKHKIYYFCYYIGLEILRLNYTFDPLNLALFLF